MFLYSMCGGITLNTPEIEHELAYTIEPSAGVSAP